MKRLLCILCLALLAFTCSGCSTPDSLQLDLYQGYGRQLKLIHLNASSGKNRERIEDFGAVFTDADPLDKDISLFAYYPDYKLEITPWQEGGTLSVVVDINGDYVDFHYDGSEELYRSKTSAADFRKLVHQPY